MRTRSKQDKKSVKNSKRNFHKKIFPALKCHHSRLKEGKHILTQSSVQNLLQANRSLPACLRNRQTPLLEIGIELCYSTHSFFIIISGDHMIEYSRKLTFSEWLELWTPALLLLGFIGIMIGMMALSIFGIFG